MTRELTDLQTTADLLAFVHHELCRKENLLEESFRTRMMVLRKSGELCGLQFSLQGPRCVKLSAVWAADQNVVYFYDTQGQRYRKERLPNRLSHESAAA